jgi:AraC-like DNA-binding protein
MYATVLLPPAARPSAAVLAAEAAILSAEGPFHVEGRYYANPGDADRQRRWAAERMVREAARQAAHASGSAAADDWRSRWRRAAAPATCPALPRVVTWLSPRDRDRMALALEGHAALSPRDTLDAVCSDLIADAADAVLLSVHRVRLCDVPRIAPLVRGFPAVSAFGVASEPADTDAFTGALLLGRAGVSAVFDCGSALGLASLRAALAPRNLADTFQRSCVSSILAAIDDKGPGTEDDRAHAPGLASFFATVFAPDAVNGKQVAARLGVNPSTLVSRFHRAGLPTLRQYVAWARLVCAARLGETAGLSISAIAHRLDASSPQSFNRGVRTLTGMSALEFRRAFTGASMLDRYQQALVIPHRDKLRSFDPLGAESRRVSGEKVPNTALWRAA